ncbi:serine/threonine-protein kinase LMTK1 isoform X4 [Ahaetulla prasina]|uniref:serine/threonine-protein kinase LMTK1 isoform X4 n=1 Tax=Ahaetulla prasina TaxID=499056 RepID=UPI00264A3360|nr:serine/threonine-protein kinase LMTK1 isoform X4 [Ahaetulla prasina]
MGMVANLLAIVMSASFFNPSFAFSSHFDPDGTPLSELSWSSSLVVVAVSFSGLFTFIFLMLACLCCKKGGIGFKEFSNADGEEYPSEFSAQGSPATQNGPEVYILPLTEVSLPMSRQPGRSVQLLKSTDLGRHSLLYLKEIGHGWFGKVFLGEVNAGLSSTQVVVKELKASASVQDQMQFLEEAQPYSDLALRNCLLTADLTVKIGDYGLSHCKYKDDYFVTADQLWVPLRWVAPELIDEVHGNLLIVDQTKTSNIWSLGVTIWELFELGGQPYCHYSDRQVLTYAIKEQQLKLPKPQLPLSLSDRWYEVMQFCWLQPEQRPTAEEVHLLLSYLCAKGASEAEEEFERRWNSMKPGGTGGSGSGSNHMGLELSSFPLLEHFSNDGDDVLTVMETSHGLNFEYKWDQGKAEHLPASAMSPGGAARYHELYYSASSSSGGGHLSLGVSPSCYECKMQGCPGLHTPGVVPVLSAHSPSLNSEYYIRIEEVASEGSGNDLDYTVCSYSPEFSHSSHWQTKEDHYESNSPTISLTMEPLLGQSAHPESHWEPSDYYSYGEQDSKEAPYYEDSLKDSAEEYLLKDPSASEWPGLALQKSIFADPLGVSPSVNYTCKEALSDSVILEVAEEEHLSDSPRSERNENSESPSSGKPWTSNTSVKNDNDHLLPSCEPLAKDSWCYRHMITFQGLMAQPLGTVPRDEPTLGIKDLRAALLGGEHMSSSSHIGSPCPDSDFPAEENVSVESAATLPGIEGSTDPLIDSRVESSQATTPPLEEDVLIGLSSTPSPLSSKEEAASSMEAKDPTLLDESIAEVSNIEEDPMEETSTGCSPKLPQEINIESGKNTSSEQDRTPDKTVSSTSFPDLDEASDEDSADLTSGVFIDFPVDCLEQQDVIPAFKTLQKQVGTPDSLDSLDIPSTTSSCDTFSPIAYISSSQPKALDSGYDTENYESPEFVLREPHESRESEGSDKLGTSEDDKDDQVKEQSLSDSFTAELQALNEKNPYRDSAYFSDYDTEGGTREDGEEDSDASEEHEPEVSQSHTEELKENSEPIGSTDEPLPAGPEPICPHEDCVGCISPGTEDQETGKDRDINLSQELLINEATVDKLDSNLFQDKNNGIVVQSQTPAPTTRSFVLSPVVTSLEEPTIDGEENEVKDSGQENVTKNTEQPEERQAIGPPKELQSNLGLSLKLSVVPSQLSCSPTDPEEEEDDTEDSDESDEELRCYNIQDQSEESEEESPAVPIVVAESHSARNLRSLLKMPSLVVETFCDDLERKKKAVSFTEDVTVYLFDQESPTKELAEQPFPGVTEASPTPPGQVESKASSGLADEINTPNSTSEGSSSEENKGGGFGWDDDFSLIPVKSPVLSSLTSEAPEDSLPRLSPTLVSAQKQVLPIQFSRFTVSPAAVSRFSITHVTDSDVQPVGGNSENGNRE